MFRNTESQVRIFEFILIIPTLERLHMKLSENITIELGESKKARGDVLSLFYLDSTQCWIAFATPCSVLGAVIQSAASFTTSCAFPIAIPNPAS